VEQVRATIAASGRVGPEDLPADVVEGLVNLFRQYRSDN
jgi:hypothetical protein